MANRLKALLLKDLKLIHRNYFLVITLAIAVLFVLVIHFAIPADLDLEPTVYVLAEENNPYASEMVERLLIKSKNAALATSFEELERYMGNSTSSYGLIVSGSPEAPRVRYHMQGYESEPIKRILEVETRKFFGDLNLKNDNQLAPVRTISEYVQEETIPFNLTVLPMFALMEPVLMGLFFIATLMFFEREQHTLQAYSVTPGRLFEFLNAKLLAMLLLGVLSLLVVSVGTVGLNANYFHLALVLVAGSFFGSSLGLLIASFFDRISKAFIWIIAVTLLLTVPLVSYYVPSFSPAFVTQMPTYSLMFALKEAYFPTGNTMLVWNASAYALGLGIICYGLMFWKYTKRFVR